MNTYFKLLSADTYVSDVVREIDRASMRVYLISTIFNEDADTEPLFLALKRAAKRGLDVDVAADMYTFTEIGGHLSFRSQFNTRLRSVSNIKRSLRKSNAKFVWLGNDTSTLLNGRTHSKWIIVDDIVYSFGGTNLYKAGLSHVDFMLKATSKEIADRLANEQRRIIASVRNRHAYRSHFFGDSTNTILIDGGFVGNSIIYKRACQLVEEAAHTIFVSQYCPNGKLARLLKTDSAELYFNPWRLANSLNAAVIRIASLITGLKTLYKKQTYIHAKFIICTMPDGTKVAITGSHNFSQGGVWLGTREIALETRDPNVIKQLEAFVKKELR